MGKSQQSKQAEQNQAQINAVNPYVKNSFQNYQDPYSTNDIIGATDNYFNNASDETLRDVNDMTTSALSQNAQSLASKGLGNGSFAADQQNVIRNNMTGQGLKSLRALKTAKLQLLPSIYNTANQNAFRNTSAAQSVDMENLNNLYRKLQLSLGNTQNMDKDSTGDDIMAGINTAANVASKFIKP